VSACWERDGSILCLRAIKGEVLGSCTHMQSMGIGSGLLLH